MQDTKVKDILDAFPVFEPIERNKLRCNITGHELPTRADQLDEYTKTKKFIRAWRIHKIMEKYGEYFDDIGENKYGCKLTMRIVAKDPDDLERHIAGKKFNRALEKGGLHDFHIGIPERMEWLNTVNSASKACCHNFVRWDA